MTLEEKKELINSANSIEELNQRMAEIEEEKEKETKAEEVKEEEKEEEPKAEENEEPKAEEFISPEEERKLIRNQNELFERKGENKMEVRNSKEYIEEFAEYIKDGEMRSLISENATNGTVAVPDFVYEIVKTNWENSSLLGKTKQISVRGNLKVNFEYASGDATEHTEGGDAVTEESLSLGIATLTPVSIKKWISISDEVYDMRGEEFLRYIYDEITRKIIKKAEDKLVGIIANLPDTATSSSVSANVVTEAPALTTVYNAIANLSDEAVNPTIVMNKLTYAQFMGIQAGAQYGQDIFAGLTVVFNNTLPAYSTASDEAVYMLVGDFENGALINNVSGNDVELKFDDTTKMTEDLIRILGRKYIGMNAIADKHFVLVEKPETV